MSDTRASEDATADEPVDTTPEPGQTGDRTRAQDPAEPADPAAPDGPGGPAGPGGPGGPGDPNEPGESAGRGPMAAVVSLVREVVLVLAIALGLSLLIKTFLVQAFFIPSPSMENTLIRGDRVLVSKLTPGPFDLKRGDVVVFADPDNWLSPVEREPEGPIRDGIRSGLMFVGLLPADSDEHLIKRLIGLPGDKVVCCDAEHRITVNGTAITEPYIYAGNAPSDMEFSITVPDGDIWVMGDHRAVSQDSRFHQDGADGGAVPISDVVGRAFVTVWPLDRFGWLGDAATTFAKVPAR